MSTIVQWDKNVYVIRGGHNQFIYKSIKNFKDGINLATFNDVFLNEIDNSEWNIVAIRKIHWYCNPWGWTLFPSKLNISEHGYCNHYWCVGEKKRVIMRAKINPLGILWSTIPFVVSKIRNGFIKEFPVMIPIFLATYYENS
jgi:hypothetical protein